MHASRGRPPHLRAAPSGGACGTRGLSKRRTPLRPDMRRRQCDAHQRRACSTCPLACAGGLPADRCWAISDSARPPLPFASPPHHGLVIIHPPVRRKPPGAGAGIPHRCARPLHSSHGPDGARVCPPIARLDDVCHRRPGHGRTRLYHQGEEQRQDCDRRRLVCRKHAAECISGLLGRQVGDQGRREGGEGADCQGQGRDAVRAHCLFHQLCQHGPRGKVQDARAVVPLL